MLWQFVKDNDAHSNSRALIPASDRYNVVRKMKAKRENHPRARMKSPGP